VSTRTEPAAASRRGARRVRRRLRWPAALDDPTLQAVVGFALGFFTTPLVMLALAGILTWLYNGLDTSGEYGVAVATTRRLASALDRYRNRHQHMPDAKVGLAALSPEFIDDVPADPWGHPYIYETTGHDWADVLSYGADRRAGGNGAGADISARFGRLGPRPPAWLRAFATLLLMGVTLAASIGAARYRWCAAAHAGIAAFWGILLIATMSGSLFGSLLTPLALIAGVACLTASIALLNGLPYAAGLGLVAVIAAYSLLQHLVSG
jgi:general secretion pathway protein G